MYYLLSTCSSVAAESKSDCCVAPTPQRVYSEWVIFISTWFKCSQRMWLSLKFMPVFVIFFISTKSREKGWVRMRAVLQIFSHTKLWATYFFSDFFLQFFYFWFLWQIATCKKKKRVLQHINLSKHKREEWMFSSLNMQHRKRPLSLSCWKLSCDHGNGPRSLTFVCTGTLSSCRVSKSHLTFKEKHYIKVFAMETTCATLPLKTCWNVL